MINLKQILVPVAVVAVGVLGAFATQMSGNSSTALQVLEPGWTDNPLPCSDTPHMCLKEGPEICTAFVDGFLKQVKGKVVSTDKTCPVILYQYPR